MQDQGVYRRYYRPFRILLRSFERVISYISCSFRGCISSCFFKRPSCFSVCGYLPYI